MEIINFKLQKFWSDYPVISEKLMPPEINITEEDLKEVGITRYACLTCLEYLKSKNYLQIDRVYGDDRISDIDHKEIEELHSVVFHLTVFKEFLPLIERYKRGTVEDVPKGVAFDRKKSILKIGDKSVSIQQKNDKPNSHYILEYIFDNPDGLEAKSYYSEILDEKFNDEDLTQRSMYRACEDINTKVSKQANVSNFLLIKSGKTGYVQINPIYLETTTS